MHIGNDNLFLDLFVFFDLLEELEVIKVFGSSWIGEGKCNFVLELPIIFIEIPLVDVTDL